MNPNKIKNEILTRFASSLGQGLTLIDVICEVVESSDNFDYHDIADIIKADATMFDVIKVEFQKRNMLPKDAEEISLVELFEKI